MTTQTLNPELPDDAGEPITFTPLEWKYFVLELKEMISAGEFNIPKVIHNARYFAELERRTEDIKAGRNIVTFTDAEWEKFIDDQNIS